MYVQVCRRGIKFLKAAVLDFALLLPLLPLLPTSSPVHGSLSCKLQLAPEMSPADERGDCRHGVSGGVVWARGIGFVRVDVVDCVRQG